MRQYINIIINLIKKILRGLKIYDFSCNLIDYFYYPKGSTIVIGIGKTGGSTVRKVLHKLKAEKQNIYNVHVRKPLYRKDLKYIILLRHPVGRVISAFNFRYKQIVENKISGIKGEYPVLFKYKTINNISKELYLKNRNPNKKVINEIKSIHHIKEDISYYIGDLLNKCDQDQIIGILTQENLNEEIEKIFKYRNEFREKVASPLRSKNLSQESFDNLVRFLEKDYINIFKLFMMGKIDQNYLLYCLRKI